MARVLKEKDKLPILVLAFFFAQLGIHRFYIGDNQTGLVYLLITILLCWTLIVPVIMWLIGFIDAISIIDSIE